MVCEKISRWGVISDSIQYEIQEMEQLFMFELTGLVRVSHMTNFYRVLGGVCLELLRIIDWTEYMVE